MAAHGWDTVLADAIQITQVFMNLGANAFHAMRDCGGALEIAVDYYGTGFGPDAPDCAWPVSPCIGISVKDDGCGIPPEMHKKVFEPGFTTKPGSEGGLGLAMVKGIVEGHGGVIEIDSRPGEGSNFSIYLPLEKQLTKSDITGTSVSNECVLLVEDDEKVLESTQEILRRNGYDVTSALNSQEALRLFHEDQQRFDIVVSDLMMPNLTGTELAREIFRFRRDLPFVLCTAYAETVNQEDIKNLCVKHVLAKPVERKTLLRTMRRVLDERDIKEL
jgi:CheY-like chemotaxis protein